MYKSKIHSNQFIIASIDKNNNWMRINYFVYPSYKDAQKDAEFFANRTHSKKYVVLAIAMVAEYRGSPVKVSYEL